MNRVGIQIAVLIQKLLHITRLLITTYVQNCIQSDKLYSKVGYI